jgi:hypothetical protein
VSRTQTFFNKTSTLTFSDLEVVSLRESYNASGESGGQRRKEEREKKRKKDRKKKSKDPEAAERSVQLVISLLCSVTRQDC